MDEAISPTGRAHEQHAPSQLESPRGGDFCWETSLDQPNGILEASEKKMRSNDESRLTGRAHEEHAPSYLSHLEEVACWNSI